MTIKMKIILDNITKFNARYDKLVRLIGKIKHTKNKRYFPLLEKLKTEKRVVSRHAMEAGDILNYLYYVERKYMDKGPIQ